MIQFQENALTDKRTEGWRQTLVHGTHSVHPYLKLLPNFQKGEAWGGGIDRTLISRGGLVRKRGVTFLEGRGGCCNFYVKNKLKTKTKL